MGDAEYAISVSKKRPAERELSRDADPDAEDEDVCGQETGSSQRACEEVMAIRKIVKVDRTESSSGETPNPFAAIELVSRTATPQVVDASKVTEGCKDEAEKIGESEATEMTKIAEKKIGEEEDLEKESTDLNSTELNTEEPERNKMEGESLDLKPVEITQEEPKKGGSSKEEPNDGEEEDDEEKANTKSLERKQPAFVKTFQQLSNAQNAFTGISGTGFSFSSFSFDTKITPPFGSTPKFGSFNFSSASAFGSLSSTGSLTGTGSLFGTKLVTDDSAPIDSPGTTSDSAAPLQLFGESATEKISAAGSGFGSLQEVPVETGEEKEEVVFTVDAALFQYINGGWKERGKGELKLNIPTVDTGRARLVMRSRGNYRLILNTNLYPDMKLTGMEQRGFSFACINSAGDGKDGLATFALKFKDSLIAEDFRAAIEAYKDRSPAQSRVLENLLKT